MANPSAHGNSHVFADDPVSARQTAPSHMDMSEGGLTSHPLTQASTEVESQHERTDVHRKRFAANGTAPHAHRFEYAGNPLSHYWTNTEGALVGPSESTFNPGYTSTVAPKRFANPAPLGLAGFAYTTFLLSIINLNTRGISTPNIVVGPALAYGGLVQLLAGMWEMASGNTFAAWAFSSYGGFWIGIGIIFTPGGFQIAKQYGGQTGAFYTVLGFYLLGWFIFTVFVWLATLRSTAAFSFLLLNVWLAFLMLACAYIANDSGSSTTGTAEPQGQLVLAGGVFGIIAAFMAWYIMLEGLQDSSNSFFIVPMFHFPWSSKDRPPGYLEDDIEALEGSEKHDAWKTKTN